MTNQQNKQEQNNSNPPIAGKDSRTQAEKDKQQATQKQDKKKDVSGNPSK